MDSFPAGLRVLVVDDDLTWLKILEKMLRKCSYEVTTCCSATSALVMLRERKDKFDIVISDVNMPDMDGFKLLEHVGLEMDLPVIMMSVDGEISRVMKGVQHGACDYLLKPVRMKELRNIWQHVFRKKIHEMKENESHDHESNEGTHMLKNGFDEFEDDFFLCAIDPNSTKKRKDSGNEEDNDQEFNSNPGTVKKARVVWSVDLHQKFVNAVNQIGFDKVGPKKILDLMNIPGLTRENVASHLQKYRLYLSRIQKQNEPNTSFCGIKSSTATHHNSSNSFTYSNNKSCVQDMGNELKGIVSFLPVKEAKNFWRDDGSDVQKLNTVPQIDAVLPFGSMVPNANCKPYGSSVSHQQTWSGKSSVAPLEQHVEQDHETHLPCEAYPHLLLHGHQNHSQVDCPQPIASVNTRTYITDKDKSGLSEIKPFYTDHKSNRVGIVSPRASRTDPFSLQLNHEYANPQVFGAVPVSSASSSSTKHDLDRNCINSWGSLQSLTLKNDSLSASSLEDLQLRSIQGYGSYDGVWHDTLEFIETSDSSSINELQSYVHDGLRFNCGYQDSTEYPVIEEGVFIT